jgi:hypothetical protein
LNAGPDHLSCILSGEDAGNLDDNLPDAQLFAVKMVDDYFSDIVQFLSTGMAPSEMTVVQKKQLVVKASGLSVDCREFIQVGSRQNIKMMCVGT